MNGGGWRRIRKRREKEMINGNMVRNCGLIPGINKHSCIYMTIMRYVPHFVIRVDESNSLVRYDNCCMHILHNVCGSLIWINEILL